MNTLEIEALTKRYRSGVQALKAQPREGHSFFEACHHLVYGQAARFEPRHRFFQPLKRLFKRDRFRFHLHSLSIAVPPPHRPAGSMISVTLLS